MRIAECFIELALKGAAAVQAGLQNVQGQLTAMQKGMEGVSSASTKAFAAATVSLGGFIRSGLAGTAQGEALSRSFALLSREITQLFLPTIEKVIASVRTLVEWFRNLTGAQQENIGKWVMLGTAALGVMMILPKIIAGFSALIGIVKMAAGAMSAMSAASGIASGGILPLIGVLVTVGAGLATLWVGTDRGRAAVLALAGAVRPVVDGFKAFGGMLGGLMDALQPVGELFVSIGTVAVASFGRLVGAVKPVFEVFGKIAAVVGEVFAGLFQALGNAVAKLGPFIDRVLKAGAAIAGELAKGVAIAAEWFNKLVDNVLPRVAEAVGPIQYAFEKVFEAIAPLLEWATRQVEVFAEALSGEFGDMGVMGTMLSDTLGKAFDFISETMTEVMGVIGVVIDLFVEFASTAAQVAMTILEAFGVVMPGMEDFKLGFEVAFAAITLVFEAFIDSLKTMKKVALDTFAAIAATAKLAAAPWKLAKGASQAWLDEFEEIRAAIDKGLPDHMKPKGPKDPYTHLDKDFVGPLDPDAAKPGGRHVLSPKGGAFESFQETHRRLQASVLKEKAEDKTGKKIDKTNSLIEQILIKMGLMPPIVGP